jgi:hypothetical protein
MNLGKKKGEFYEGLLLEALVEGHPCKVTIDTGSSIAILIFALLSCSETSLNNLRPVRSSIRIVSGEKVPLVGRGQMTITIANRQSIHDVWISNISEDIILGLDFMKLHRCQVNSEYSSFCVNGEYVSLVCTGKNELHCFRIVFNSNVVIRSRSEIIIKGLVRRPKPAKDCVSRSVPAKNP